MKNCVGGSHEIPTHNPLVPSDREPGGGRRRERDELKGKLHEANLELSADGMEQDHYRDVVETLQSTINKYQKWLTDAEEKLALRSPAMGRRFSER